LDYLCIGKAMGEVSMRVGVSTVSR
jgi:hypothetical protein